MAAAVEGNDDVMGRAAGVVAGADEGAEDAVDDADEGGVGEDDCEMAGDGWC